MKSYKYLLLALMLFVCFLQANSQNPQYKQYVDTFKSIAMDKMAKFKIPASISLAQGILESNAGNSYLAKTANNHFGIKCYDGWKGASVRKDDDKSNECFKKYNTVGESFDDHSKFLQRDRYKSLYNLSPTDYKGWAHGLKAAGYATDKSYAYKLIKIIEDYKLYEYDTAKQSNTNNKTNTTNTGNSNNQQTNTSNKPVFTNNSQLISKQERTVYQNNGVEFVFVLPGDTYQSIAQECKVKEKNIYKFNECDASLKLRVGDVMYLGKKKGKAEKPNFDYVVKSGDSMYNISQKYGVKVTSLYKMNKLSFGSSIAVGQVLRLR